MQLDGSHACDNCGTDVSPGSLNVAVVVSAVHPENPTMVENYHFCLDREVDGEKIKGCEHKVLRPSVLKNYNGEN